jgi:iron complex transport system ATP-binding protein
MTAASVYRIQDLRFAYSQTPVLNGISTTIFVGDFVALVGPNGAGKSTFLKILAGLNRRYAGTVEFDSVSLAKVTSHDLARRVAFVPQETHVAFPFSVNQMVLMGRAPHQSASLFDSGIDIERAEYAMRLTDTLDLSKKAFTALSGGERQRVVLASALAQDPEVLLLDEPTVYLDLKHQIHFYDIVERLNLDHRMTIVSVTHDVNLAARYARRMIAMRAGRFVVDGVPESVLTPEHLYEIFEVSVSVFKRTDGRGSYIIPA